MREVLNETMSPSLFSVLAVGQAESGDLVAVMGASGSGKTSLLSCLALRQTGFHGSVYLNDQPVSRWCMSVVGKSIG